MDFKSRKITRLKDFDYSSNAAYFITICTEDRKNFFGKITHDNVILNQFGKIAEEIWHSLENQFKDIVLDEFIVMPNHIHGIILKLNTENIIVPPENLNGWILMKNPKAVLGKFVRYYKAKTSYQIHKTGFINFKWQRNYYEHIIRNDEDLENARNYVHYNYLNWKNDKEFQDI